MKISIGFSSAKNDLMLFGRLIELVEKRSFSHAFVIYKDPITNTDMVFQAAHGIVHICEYSAFLVANTLIKKYELDLTTDEYSVFYSSMLKCLGVRYGWLEILGIALNKLLHIKSPFHDGLETMICSELAARVCKIKGIEINDSDLDSLTPSDLDRILEGIYGKTQ